MTKHYLSMLDMDPETARAVLDRALEMKRTRHRSRLLDGKIIALLFEKASTRTRLSFEVAVRHLGGEALFLSSRETQLGRNEPVRDFARVVSRYLDGLVVRTYAQQTLDELVAFATIPVVNALSDQFHPCQTLSDLLTVYERRPDLENLVIAWVGDGNNMANSWMNAAALFPFTLRMATPHGFEPSADVLARSQRLGAKIELGNDPVAAVTGAHFVNTDVWVSMGQDDPEGAKRSAFEPFQVNDTLMAHAAEGAMFMHCLPAHRSEEVTEAVFESNISIVWDQAENRLHTQKAILEWIFTQD
ncbi:ornithine carbamoyltransferase [Megalodesulfovibrio gigas]|uniref:Ornithine carbamoyltransferase n=1 Tax=Megalodesulfovibrio gigas (strain ATCC 19364 / DSM 1382 / NCIMB 9332 / VKM B-1759) TaxID=1121448 RepID=T2GDC4_MEGG1|nr:ornithine carbamoyltransferase [Megalodesulfovibrio gigas]AGW13922.1 putative ornithine carbamoyltransferase [Megalodesulfovibrio gigas DSM 1382 = ATCC 19364]